MRLASPSILETVQWAHQAESALNAGERSVASRAPVGCFATTRSRHALSFEGRTKRPGQDRAEDWNRFRMTEERRCARVSKRPPAWRTV